MINITGLGLSNDGKLQRINIMWDEISDDGKTISTNNRLTRIITDEGVKLHIEALFEVSENIISSEE